MVLFFMISSDKEIAIHIRENVGLHVPHAQDLISTTASNADHIPSYK